MTSDKTLRESIIESLEESRNNILDGNVNCIPLPFERYREDFPGIRKKFYYLVSGATKSSKTQITNYLFVMTPIFYYIDHPDHLYITDDYIVTHNTTIARIMAGFLYKYGYIKENKCIEIDGNFLKAGTESALKTELVIRAAYGGVLFIDEAYALMESGDGSGEQVIATLIKQMEDNRDKFILIIAGYTN